MRIEETRPISKTKHWRILEIVQRRRVADVRPIELESDAEIPETTDAEEQAEQLQDPIEAQDSIEGAAGDSPDDDAGAVDTGPGDTER